MTLDNKYDTTIETKKEEHFATKVDIAANVNLV